MVNVWLAPALTVTVPEGEILPLAPADAVIVKDPKGIKPAFERLGSVTGDYAATAVRRYKALRCSFTAKRYSGLADCELRIARLGRITISLGES